MWGMNIMFDLNDVNSILDSLSEEYLCFASEAHFQLMFAFEANKQFGEKYLFYPEWPCNAEIGNKKDHIDLMIVDENKEKTFIEFKYKTRKGCTYTLPPDVKITPSNMGARSIAKYDCWKDIQRLEKHVDNREASNAFFIFLTNDPLYWKERNASEVYGDDFSMEDGNHSSKPKRWKDADKVEKAIGEKRKDPIITKDYNFEYTPYSKTEDDKKAGEFKVLVVDIKSEDYCRKSLSF